MLQLKSYTVRVTNYLYINDAHTSHLCQFTTSSKQVNLSTICHDFCRKEATKLKLETEDFMTLTTGYLYPDVVSSIAAASFTDFYPKI